MTQSLAATLADRSGLDDGEQFGLYTCFDELAENVVFHADSPIGGIIAAWQPADEYEVEIAVADVGVGLRTSLIRNAAYADVADDLDAVTRVLASRVTSTPHRNAGLGLPIVAVTFQDNGGALYLRSGSAAAVVDGGTVATATALHLPGTLTAARLRTDLPFDIDVAYTQLAPYFDDALRERGLLDDDDPASS